MKEAIQNAVIKYLSIARKGIEYSGKMYVSADEVEKIFLELMEAAKGAQDDVGDH